MNHSCEPNACFHSRRAGPGGPPLEYVLRCTADVAAGEEVCVSYLAHFSNAAIEVSFVCVFWYVLRTAFLVVVAVVVVVVVFVVISSFSRPRPHVEAVFFLPHVSYRAPPHILSAVATVPKSTNFIASDSSFFCPVFLCVCFVWVLRFLRLQGRRELLENVWGFSCDCPRCQDDLPPGSSAGDWRVTKMLQNMEALLENARSCR